MKFTISSGISNTTLQSVILSLDKLVIFKSYCAWWYPPDSYIVVLSNSIFNFCTVEVMCSGSPLDSPSWWSLFSTSYWICPFDNLKFVVLLYENLNEYSLYGWENDNIIMSDYIGVQSIFDSISDENTNCTYIYNILHY